ncbi:energy-coupling factor transporter ATPase [Alkaliphilus peptidifermentans]|uniref:Energy-coupling factor transporter ATP-binding protein EcfA2 n=1 Tax=Alkaliphilus peptidifermentans DSM 18978 TaxID=1120976 RepID=A0A1G5L7T1_9FIRM|nr:energy-coupling factor transporter ATPase [Alkaliphilus peptidifermentans]SCZ09013.1 energy-coupling factor transport system ATP-binding protein [Alkaliphilus peptidifermentans DSM 18978]
MSIKIENLTHVYNPNSPFQTIALDDISFEIKDGEFVGLIGHTGSGKSTLIQHLNGLLKPTSGKIFINDVNIAAKEVKLGDIRKNVGLVFQYPEHQLFEETVYKDIAFGPANLGLSGEDIVTRVRESMDLVKLPFELLKDRSPFELSGGQRRRVAIAGVLAMKPDFLVLDEPTAGLDPKGRDEILEQIKNLHQQVKNTVILVSHSMEDIAKLVDRIIVMHRGKVSLMGSPREVFKEVEVLESIGLGIPQITYLMKKLKENNINLKQDILTIEEAKEEIIKWIRGNSNA